MNVGAEAMALACMPADDSALARMREGVPEEHQAEFDAWRPSEGSVRGTCLACGVDIWIGGRQTLVLDLDPDTPTICIPCVAVARRNMRHLGFESEAISLGE